MSIHCNQNNLSPWNALISQISQFGWLKFGSCSRVFCSNKIHMPGDVCFCPNLMVSLWRRHRTYEKKITLDWLFQTVLIVDRCICSLMKCKDKCMEAPLNTRTCEIFGARNRTQVPINPIIQRHKCGKLLGRFSFHLWYLNVPKHNTKKDFDCRLVALQVELIQDVVWAINSQHWSFPVSTNWKPKIGNQIQMESLEKVWEPN